MILFLQGCQTLKKQDSINTIEVHKKLDFLFCNTWFEDMEKNKISLNKVFQNKVDFFEIYECISQKKESVYLTRSNPEFYIEYIYIDNNGHRYKPYYNYINGIGLVNIFFEMEANTKATIIIKNTYGVNKYEK